MKAQQANTMKVKQLNRSMISKVIQQDLEEKGLKEQELEQKRLARVKSIQYVKTEVA